jgi:hypothetical protein
MTESEAMTKRNEATTGSLSFKDRTLSKAAAKELFNTKSPHVLGGIIDTTVGRIKQAKTTKAEKATDAYFAYRTVKLGPLGGDARAVRLRGGVSKAHGKSRENA